MFRTVLKLIIVCAGVASLFSNQSLAQSEEVSRLKQIALQQMRASKAAQAAYDSCTASQRGKASKECSRLAEQWKAAAANYLIAYNAYDVAKNSNSQQNSMSSETGNTTGKRSQDTGRYGILSGDWVADCTERDGGVFCHRFGGFVTNTYPAGCEGNAAFFCRGISLCELASIVPVIATDIGNGVRLAPGIASCAGHKRPR